MGVAVPGTGWGWGPPQRVGVKQIYIQTNLNIMLPNFPYCSCEANIDKFADNCKILVER